jgi:hypothetical protein
LPEEAQQLGWELSRLKVDNNMMSVRNSPRTMADVVTMAEGMFQTPKNTGLF